MKLRHKFAHWLLKSAIPHNTSMSATCCSGSDDNDGQLRSDRIALNVFPGLGGVAIEAVRYDRQTGDRKVTLHIIPEGNELSDALSKIVTLESIKGC